MTTIPLDAVDPFMEALGLDEYPMAVLFSDEKPEGGFHPSGHPPPTLEQERAGQVDYEALGKRFSCSLGHIWRARRKRSVAWFSKDHFGCLGAAYWMGFNKPQLDGITQYVSQGEGYCSDFETMRRIFDDFDPEAVPTNYLVFKPLEDVRESETPEFVSFFARPEALSGLAMLAMFVTGDVEAVQAPWGAACGGLVAWPMKYRQRGLDKAVMGGCDPSARKFFKPDELSFTVPLGMLEAMLVRWPESFLPRKTWQTVRKKIERSKRAWGE